MIKVKGLKVSYGNQKVLRGIEIDFPSSGLFSICGPSGCGKSTLLNCLSGLASYSGSIMVDGIDLSHLSRNEKDKLRLYNYGFIFQDFKLFENETVKENVLFPLKMISNEKPEIFERKVSDLLTTVSLWDKKKEIVSNLSGGQKQRVSIARALANDPKIILADEPTGALDTQTGQNIMLLLKQISKRVLVIMVTHDVELAKENSDTIIYMNDGKIAEVVDCNNEKKVRPLSICRNGIISKKPSIPMSFLAEHTFHSIKQKKGRSVLCGIITSLSLIGFGGSIVLTDNVSKNIKNSYSNLLEKDRVTISTKPENQTSFGLKAAEPTIVNSIAQNNKDIVTDIGAVYECDFESFFKDSNAFYIFDVKNKQPLPNFSIRSINEYRWLSDNKEIVRPTPIQDLEDDQVILSINFEMVLTICWQLRIARTIDSLAEYIRTSKLYIYLDVANYDWEYTDQQLFNVVGFVLDANIGFYHSNPLWNEYVFEEQMKFPSSRNITGSEAYPWVMRKANYLKTKNVNDTYELLKRVRNDNTYMDVILEKPDTSIYLNLYRNVENEDINRLIAYENYGSNIHLSYEPYFIKSSPNISAPIYGCDSGYSIYPSNLMSGFSMNTYFSLNRESLDKVLDANSTLSVGENEFASLPDDVLSGHFAKSLQNSVKFSVFNGNLLSGREPKNVNDVAISSAMYKALTKEPLTSISLFISYTSKENVKDGKIVDRQFITKTLNVTGIVDDEKYTIYQDSFWTIGYFQCYLGVSAFNLNVNTISYKVNSSDKVDETISQLESKFPQFDIVNPFSDVNASVDEICGWIEVALTIFSCIAIVTSILLLSICNYLHILDNKKDIALARCIGASRNESKKFIYSHSLIMCLISFIMASFELLILSIFTSLALSKSLMVDFTFSFNPLAILLMLVLCILISIGSSFIMGIKITKIDPLEALK